MRWNSDTARFIRDQLAENTCPLCGGRIETRHRRFWDLELVGGWGDEYEDFCVSCGMVVDGGYSSDRF